MAAPSVQALFALHHTIEGYKVVNSDAASPSYDGFVNGVGEWYILKTTVSGDVTTYGWYRGASAYSTGWTNRASHTYVQFDDKSAFGIPS